MTDRMFFKNRRMRWYDHAMQAMFGLALRFGLYYRFATIFHSQFPEKMAFALASSLLAIFSTEWLIYKWRRYGQAALPDHLDWRFHEDYFWPLSLIPRWATSFEWGVPKKIWGNQRVTRIDKDTQELGPGPIGEKKSWQVSRFPDMWGPVKYLPIYFAFTLKSGKHFRIGARFDDVDSYVTFPTIAFMTPSEFRGEGK